MAPLLNVDFVIKIFYFHHYKNSNKMLNKIYKFKNNIKGNGQAMVLFVKR